MDLEGREDLVGMAYRLTEVVIQVGHIGCSHALGCSLIETAQDGTEQFGRKVGGRLRLAPTVDVVENLRDEVV